MTHVFSTVMVIFLVVGALDKAFFHSKYGYGAAFDEGLNTIGPLTLLMIGIMCFAPVIGASILPLLVPLFLQVGINPALVAGFLFPVDAGGLALTLSLTQDKTAIYLLGIGLCSTLACILTLPLPFSLAIVSAKSRPYVAKGIVAGLIASPFSMFFIAILLKVQQPETFYFFDVFMISMPAFTLAILLALALSLAQEKTIHFFITVGKFLMGIYTLLLMLVAVSHLLSLPLGSDIAPLEPQLVIVGEIGLTLAGAYPLVHFIKCHGGAVLRFISASLRIDTLSALGMITALANPLPMYSLLEKMTPRSKVLASAFSGPALCALGDHAAFINSYYPDGLTALFIGKLGAAIFALFLALFLENLRPSPPKNIS